MDRFHLTAQVVRHGRALGFVLRIQCITKSWAFGVKHAHRIVGAHVLAQLLHHVDHAANGTGRRTGRIARVGAQVRHGVKSPVQVA